MTKKSKTLGQCILDCNDDNSCEMDCVLTFKNEQSECPCQVNSSSQTTFSKYFRINVRLAVLVITTIAIYLRKMLFLLFIQGIPSLQYLSSPMVV